MRKSSEPVYTNSCAIEESGFHGSPMTVVDPYADGGYVVGPGQPAVITQPGMMAQPAIGVPPGATIAPSPVPHIGPAPIQGAPAAAQSQPGARILTPSPGQP